MSARPGQWHQMHGVYNVAAPKNVSNCPADCPKKADKKHVFSTVFGKTVCEYCGCTKAAGGRRNNRTRRQQRRNRNRSRRQRN